ncbi:MAG: tyrosine-type recombinase/integrase, partial [Synergistaceae bacterium]|nr:tyrosine-type recombinase/integrase [Synergistaceae bacterium]
MRQKINKTTQPIRSQSDRDALSSYFWNHNLRDYAFFQFGIATGRRISDLIRLNVRDVARIDRKGRFCIVERFEVREKKTGKFANIMLHPSARRALSKYLRQRRKNSESLGALLNEPLFKSRKHGRDGEYR